MGWQRPLPATNSVGEPETRRLPLTAFGKRERLLLSGAIHDETFLHLRPPLGPGARHGLFVPDRAPRRHRRLQHLRQRASDLVVGRQDRPRPGRRQLLASMADKQRAPRAVAPRSGLAAWSTRVHRRHHRRPRDPRVQPASPSRCVRPARRATSHPCSTSTSACSARASAASAPPAARRRLRRLARDAGPSQRRPRPPGDPHRRATRPASPTYQSEGFLAWDPRRSTRRPARAASGPEHAPGLDDVAPQPRRRRRASRAAATSRRTRHGIASSSTRRPTSRSRWRQQRPGGDHRHRPGPPHAAQRVPPVRLAAGDPRVVTDETDTSLKEPSSLPRSSPSPGTCRTPAPSARTNGPNDPCCLSCGQ